MAWNGYRTSKMAGGGAPAPRFGEGRLMQPRVHDNDSDEITVTLDGTEIRGWSYETETERRVKMLAAREFCEGWYACHHHMDRKPQMDDRMATEIFHPIADMDEWAAFWAANGEALTEEVGDEDKCIALASNCSLIIGGGATPLTRVGFVD